jgi:TonB family protein
MYHFEMSLPVVPVGMDARTAANEFNAHIFRYTSGVFVVSVTMGLADGFLTSACEMRNVPATRTFMHTADGRTYTVVLDVNADGSATANFDVVENEVKIVSATKTFLPTQPQPSPADGIYQRLGVGSNVKAPTLIDRVEPILPPDERAAGITGIVIVEVKINDRGTVDDVKVLKVLPFGLDQAAADAVRQWTFRPGTLGDQPVPVVVNLVVNSRRTR